MASHANGETLSRRAVNHRAVAASVDLLGGVALVHLRSDREPLRPLSPDGWAFGSTADKSARQCAIPKAVGFKRHKHRRFRWLLTE